MLRIAICDDAAAYGDWLAGFVEEWALGRRLNIQLRTFISGEELLADIEAKGYYDVVIMDIDFHSAARPDTFFKSLQQKVQIRPLYPAERRNQYLFTT